jgi:MurNAc alpha-1-phosphate uridylyltransferase
MAPVVILAGGLGTRLGAQTRALPKSLVDVNGEPFVAHQLRRLRDQGIRRVLICVGHRGGQIVEAVGDGRAFGLSVEYAFDGPRLLGTAGAIKRALDRLPEVFFLLYGDSYLECDFAAALSAFEAAAKLALMTVFANRQRWDDSNVEFADGRILSYDKIHRTARMRHIDYGLGVLDRRAFAEVADGEPCDLAAVYRDMLVRDQLAAFEVFTRFYEVGSPAGLEATRRHLLGHASASAEGGERWTTRRGI